MLSKTFILNNEQETASIAKQLALHLQPPLIIYLYGDLGAGKTTFTRYILRQLGINEPIVSPTYSLLESYDTVTIKIIHLDLYRIHHAEEMIYLGLNDLINSQTICLIEWPQHGANFIPPSDLNINIEIINQSRHLRYEAISNKGENLLRLIN